MVTYNWNCRSVEAYIEQSGNSDVVYKVNWVVTGTSDVLDPNSPEPFFQYSMVGTQDLNTSDITNFIPFDQVTNTEVVAWTQAAMGPEEVTSIEDNINNILESLINPTTIALTVGN